MFFGQLRHVIWASFRTSQFACQLEPPKSLAQVSVNAPIIDSGLWPVAASGLLRMDDHVSAPTDAYVYRHQQIGIAADYWHSRLAVQDECAETIARSMWVVRVLVATFQDDDPTIVWMSEPLAHAIAVVVMNQIENFCQELVPLLPLRTTMIEHNPPPYRQAIELPEPFSSHMCGL